jgi:hypothetical protein
MPGSKKSVITRSKLVVLSISSAATPSTAALTS